LKVDTKGYHGNVRRSAKVSSNDPNRPEITLNVQMFIDVPITLEPRGAMLGGSTEEDIRQRVVIQAHKEKPLALEPGINSSPDKVSFEVEKAKDGKEFHVILKNISKQVDDKYNGSITFKTNYPDQPEISVPYIGYIWKPGTVIPKLEDLEPSSSQPEKE